MATACDEGQLSDQADFFQQMVNPQISNFDSEKFRDGRLVRFDLEVHVGLWRCVAAFFVITGFTARHTVFERRFATPWFWDDMVKG